MTRWQWWHTLSAIALDTDTVFGQVYEGMEVVDTIAQTGVDEAQRPTEPITINSVTITKYE